MPKHQPTLSAKNDTGEFGNFTRLIDRLLSVPHANPWSVAVATQIDQARSRTVSRRVLDCQ